MLEGPNYMAFALRVSLRWTGRSSRNLAMAVETDWTHSETTLINYLIMAGFFPWTLFPLDFSVDFSQSQLRLSQLPLWLSSFEALPGHFPRFAVGCIGPHGSAEGGDDGDIWRYGNHQDLWWFNGVLMGFNQQNMVILMGCYPLVMSKVAIENDHE